MATLIFILAAAGIAYLAIFHKPQNYTDTEIKKWFSSKLSDITAGLERDIEKDIAGEYPHAGKQSFTPRGSITYILLDKRYKRFDISDKNALPTRDIIATDGYRALADKARLLELKIRLDESMVEGDDVDTFNDLGEDTDDFPRYYTMTISGW